MVAEPGQKIVLYIVVATLSISALVIVSSNIAVGTAKLPQQLVRFALTALLSYYLYRGARPARWIAIVLFGIAGLGSTLGGVSLLQQLTAAVPMLAMAVVYWGSAGLLLLHPSVRSHFETPVSAA